MNPVLNHENPAQENLELVFPIVIGCFKVKSTVCRKEEIFRIPETIIPNENKNTNIFPMGFLFVPIGAA